MIALVAGFLLVGYLLAPGAIFRFVLSLFFPAKRFQRTRTEEVLFSIQATLLPFLLTSALLFVTPVGRLPHWQVGGDKSKAYQQCARSLIGSSSSQDVSQSFQRAFLEQIRFVSFLWVFCAFEACVAGLIIRRYGDLKQSGWVRGFCDKFLLRQVSEWYVLFSRMALSSKDDRTQVVVDVLTSQDLLYRGVLVDWFLDSDGKLAGIFLERAERFNRDELKKDREAGKKSPADAYWRQIPGAKLYLTAASIVNYNIRYVRPVTAKEQDDVEKELNLGQTATITPLVE